MEVNGNEGKQYRSVKVLTAWSMTRDEYNKYRGWEPPAGEDQDVAGYLVEYDPPGNGSNDTRHEGYISWQLGEVFEVTYVELADGWAARVLEEEADLHEKIGKLRAFRATSQYADLPQNAKDLLAERETVMLKYSDVLARRVASDTDEINAAAAHALDQ